MSRDGPVGGFRGGRKEEAVVEDVALLCLQPQLQYGAAVRFLAVIGRISIPTEVCSVAVFGEP